VMLAAATYLADWTPARCQSAASQAR